MQKLSLRYRVALVIVLLLLADQILKIWVKTHMVLGEQYHILGNWFIIHFTENPGMAFGMEFWGENGKLFLSIFRIIASILLCLYISWLIKKKTPAGVIWGMSLILVGALGNVIDSAFYGLIFGESYYEPATLFPAGGGYAGFLHGRVVDMLYFPIIKTTWPHWAPWVGGQPFIFFRPIFNIADSAITIGVFYLLIFQRKFLFEKHS